MSISPDVKNRRNLNIDIGTEPTIKKRVLSGRGLDKSSFFVGDSSHSERPDEMLGAWPKAAAVPLVRGGQALLTRLPSVQRIGQNSRICRLKSWIQSRVKNGSTNGADQG